MRSACAGCDVAQKAEEGARCWNCNGPTKLIPGDWPELWSSLPQTYSEPVAQPVP